MESIRVLQVLDRIELNNGVSSVVMNYYNNIDSKYINFDFLIHGEIDDYTRVNIENRGSKIYLLPELKLKNIFRYNRELKDLFSSTDYKIVHGHLPTIAMFYFTYAKKFGVPIRILHSHNAQGSDMFYKKIRNYLMTRIGIRKSNTFFACSNYAGRYMFGLKRMKNDNVYIMNNAINLNGYTFDNKIRCYIRDELSLNNKFIIMTVGRFVPQKNQKFLLKVFYEISKRDQNCYLVLIGDGPLRKDLEDLVRSFRIESRVIFTGVVNCVNDYLQAADLFVLPSKFEGLPVVCVEAQQSGLPCLLSNNITKEVKVSDNIEFLPFKPKVWVEKILWFKENLCRSHHSIRDKKFDISYQAELLKQKYISLYESI